LDLGAVAAERTAAPAPRIEHLLKCNNAMQLLTNAAWYFAAPFIPLYLISQGASVGEVGTIIGVAAIFPLLISIHAGALVDQRGPTPVNKVSVLLYAAAAAVLVALRGVWWVGLAYGLLGVANIGFAVAPQAIVAAISTPKTRIRNYGQYALWNSAGAVVGPIIGGAVVARFGYQGTFAMLGLLMLPCFILAVILAGVPTVPRHTVSLANAHTHVGAILRRRGVGGIMFASGMGQWGNTLQQTFYPVYLGHVGMPANLIGIVIAAVSCASMLVRSLLSRGVSRFGYARLLLAATVVAGMSLGITPLLRGFWPLMGASALMGASLGFTQPLTMSLLVGAVGADMWGVGFGIRQSVQRLSSVFSPVAYGLVITAYGLAAGFFAGALTFAAAVPVMARLTRELSDPAD
jgi:MFS family permease